MGNENPPGANTSDILSPATVKAATQSISDMYSAVVKSMNMDAQKLLLQNGASAPPDNKDIRILTTNIMTLMGTRLQEALLKAGVKTPNNTETK